MKRQNSFAREPAAESKQAYDKAILVLLVLLAFLIPLKFGVPNLDVSSPILPTDLSGMGRYLTDFFRAIFSLKLRTALRILSDVLSTPWPEEIAEIVILLAVFLWGMRSFSRGTFLLRVGRVDAMMWLFVLAGFVATIVSPGFHSSMVILKQFVGYALLYFLVVHALDTPEQQRKLIKYFLISTAVVALLGLHQFFLGFQDVARSVEQNIPPELRVEYLVRIARRRVFSVFVYPNSLAGFLLVALPMTLLYGALHREWFKGKNVKKMIAYGIVLPLPCFVSFLLTQSKAGFLTFFIVAIASVIAARKKLGLKPRVLWAILLVLLILLSALVVSPLGRKLVIEKGGFTLSERLDYWQTGCRMVLRSPVIGNGFNSFGLLYSRYRLPGTGEARSAHNNFLQILVETGVVGFLFFIGIWVFAVWPVWPFVRGYLRGEKADPLRETLVLSAVVSISCFLIHSLADFDLYIPGIAMTVYLFLGLMVKNARPAEGRQIRLTAQRATACTLALVVLCGLGVFYTSKTLNASSHLALAQSIVEDTDTPPEHFEYERAIGEMKKALWWDGTNHNLHLHLAGIYSQLKWYDEALGEYAISDCLLHGYSPMIAHHTARTILAKTKEEGKVDWVNVLKEFSKAVSRSPASSFHRLVYAYYLLQAGRPGESQRELREAKRLDRLDPTGEKAIKTAQVIYRGDPLVDELKRFFEGTPDNSRQNEGK